jgi:outer membrane protein OmpA-like peptidoglycan-associated protein
LGHIYNAPYTTVKDDFASTNISLSLGIEVFPRQPITLFGRYIHGLTDVDNRDVDDGIEYFNNAFQVGFKLKLFGKFTPADTDADGIPDRDDDCPTVAGIAAFMGCPDTDNDGITDASDECPTVAGIEKYKGCPIPDTDKDGINDELDKCINTVGVAKYNGCPIPDTDGDGVNDDDDKCVSVKGLAKYDGCPIPDSDGDGVNDEMDKCPGVAGLAQFDGCPNPDRDNDGVADASDGCPDVPGPASNEGCPVVESAKFNGRMINFVSGSSKLTSNSKAALKEAASIMLSDPFNKLMFHIHGHTDNVGSDEFNLKLSRERAESVRQELIKDGVPASRMSSEGFGESKPIATNDTADGRALNRRTEILARHSQAVDESVKVPK